MAKEQNFAHPPRGHVAILAYDDVNDRWQVVECSPEGYLKIRIIDQIHMVTVQQSTPSVLQPGINTYDGSGWHKQAPIWGYSDRWLEQVNKTVTVAGWNFLETAGVDSGYVYVSNAFAAVNQTRDPTSIQLGINVGGARYYVKRVPTPGANIYAEWLGVGNYKVGDKAVAAIEGCQIGDLLTFNVWGYKMNIDM